MVATVVARPEQAQREGKAEGDVYAECDFPARDLRAYVGALRLATEPPPPQ